MSEETIAGNSPMRTQQGLPQLDERAGAVWQRTLDDSTRLRLMAALLSRFNHDLRTPINTVSGWMHLLQHSSDAARIAHVSSVISRNVTEQTTLLEEFVDDSRVLIGNLTAARAPITVRDVLGVAFERATAVASLHAVELQTRLPEPGQPIHADGPRLQRLFYRVVAAVIRRSTENAVVEVKATADGSDLTASVCSSAFNPDWSEAALLDLQLATLHATLHGGRLEMASPRAELLLSVPAN